MHSTYSGIWHQTNGGHAPVTLPTLSVDVSHQRITVTGLHDVRNCEHRRDRPLKTGSVQSHCGGEIGKPLCGNWWLYAELCFEWFGFHVQSS